MGANKLRGEVSIAVAGQQRLMKLGANELCALEAIYPDVSFFALVDTLTDPDTLRFELVRTFLKVSLMRPLPDITDAEVGDLIDEVGMKSIVQKLMECSQNAFPAADEVDTDEAAADDPKAKAAAANA